MVQKLSNYQVTPKMQALINFAQAAPVQNTWYVVLDTTKNCRVILADFRVATVGETCDIKITIDGIVYQVTGGAGTAFNADTYYHVYFYMDGALFVTVNDVMFYRSFFVEGRTIKIEFRKTTANGAGDLIANVIYQTW